MKIYIFIVHLFCVTTLFSQTTIEDKIIADSLHSIITSDADDTTKIIARTKFGIVANLYRITYWDSIIYDSEKIIALTSSDEIKKSLYSSLAESMNNVGFIYNNEGRINKALTYFLASLKISEKLNDKKGIASRLNNIGYIYSNHDNNKKALEFYEKSLKIRKNLGDKAGVAGSLNNIGSIYTDMDDPIRALRYHEKSLEIKKEIKDLNGIAISLNNIGSIYSNQGDIKKALDYHTKSLKIREELKDYQMISYSLNHVAKNLLKQGRSDLAKKYAERSFSISKKIGYPDNIKYSAKLLSEIYELENNTKKSLDMYKLYILMRDSIDNKSTQKMIVQQQARYEYDKKKAITDKEHEKQLAVSEEQEKKQKIVSYTIAGGLILVLLFLIFVYNRLQITRKQKVVIEDQKQEVEFQKMLVDNKNKEITDSITYAKRIQNAILPPMKMVEKYLVDSFIFYKPKDIVAGDFYWMEVLTPLDTKEESDIEDVILFAAADCTGHGVPGAMVSVVCNNALNRSVREYGLTIPGEILDKTRAIVIEEFEKSDEEVKDGMDIALCSLKGNILQYAGAHNPLWIIRQDELIVIKANKQPIGKYENLEPYTTHSIELEKGDAIYIFSDGYVDQFGGKKGKKFKVKSFRELLISIQDLTMKEQKNKINTVFEDWKAEQEQIDDVCVIGVRV